MNPTNEQENNLKEKIEYTEKMQSYLKAKEDIFDFIIRRKMLKDIGIYFSIITIILFLGGNAFIEYKIKNQIDTKIAEKINVEAQYLEQRNKITQLGDIAISRIY